MRIPTIRGVIDRRVLVNFRVDPDVLARVCPAPFRPQIVNGFGVAGICLIRLKSIRPKLFPACLGISSENAAHRIAVVSLRKSDVFSIVKSQLLPSTRQSTTLNQTIQRYAISSIVCGTTTTIAWTTWFRSRKRNGTISSGCS